ncbi:MAG: nucleotidyltransferase family protein [Candidatus Bathyarchaeia archaeon]|nr:nucleotidyltransferase family protein [Candidatus Bathyarchaeota archaeon]
MKKRFCMTLDEELMNKLWRYIDGVKLKNRSQAVEFFIKLGIQNYRVERSALILCGGLGVNLRPLTFITPKPMLPIGYQPLLQYQIEYLKKYEFDRIILAVGYLQEQIIKYFSNGQRFDVKILYSFEKDPLDTGGAVKNAEELINGHFITLNGDIIFDKLDLDKLLVYHKEKGGVATLTLTKYKEPLRYGLVEIDEEGRVTKFIEKPSEAKSGLINAGIYAFSQEIFNYINKGKKVSLEKDVFPKLAEEGKLYGFIYDGYWRDVGVPEDYIEALKDILTGKLKL